MDQTTQKLFMGAAGTGTAAATFTAVDVGPSTYVAGDEAAWQPRNILGLIHAAGAYFIIGYRGNTVGTFATARSTDGRNWVTSTSLGSAWSSQSTASAGASIIYNNSIFLAAGGTGRVATSVDGVTWVNQAGLISVGFNRNLTSLSWNGSVFLVAGNEGYVATSPDGVTWTLQTGLRSTAWGVDGTVASVVWNGSVFVAVGSNGSRCATSPNGITWTYQTGLNTAYANTFFNKVYYDGTKLWALGSSGRLATSTDNGVTWSANTGISSINATANLRDILFNGSYYLVCNSTAGILRSQDGITWTNYAFSLFNGGQTGSYPRHVAWDGSNWLIANDFYSDIAVSTNPIFTNTTWSVSFQISRQLNFTSIYWDGEKAIVGTAFGGLYTTNGSNTTWTYYGSLKNSSWGAYSINGITKVGSIYYTVGERANAATSSDGLIWTHQPGLASVWGTSFTANGIAYGNGIFVACGSSGRIATSTDGITWTNISGLSSTAFSTSNCVDIDFGNGKFIVVGGRFVATSTDGIAWTTVDLSSASANWGFGAATSCLWSGTHYIVGGAGRFTRSVNGVTWSPLISIPNTPSSNISDIASSETELFAINTNSSSGNNYMSSLDNGASWTGAATPIVTTYLNFTKVTRAAGSYLAIGTRFVAVKFTRN